MDGMEDLSTGLSSTDFAKLIHPASIIDIAEFSQSHLNGWFKCLLRESLTSIEGEKGEDEDEKRRKSPHLEDQGKVKKEGEKVKTGRNGDHLKTRATVILKAKAGASDNCDVTNL